MLYDNIVTNTTVTATVTSATKVHHISCCCVREENADWGDKTKCYLVYVVV